MVYARRKLLKDRHLLEKKQIDILESQSVGQIRSNELSEESFSDEKPNFKEESKSRKSDEIDLSIMSNASTTDLIFQNSFVKAYVDLGRETYGKYGYLTAVTCIVLQQLMVCISYFYFINEYIPSIVALIALIPI